ncbi:DUF7344 domain-containing protein [Halobellus sp. GM3]|uniref:DUF7344 domain-containing protein n=1 Tax=Halobellus sp. GM3 TaxID=3458410 RepID=UPI00403DB2FD
MSISRTEAEPEVDRPTVESSSDSSTTDESAPKPSLDVIFDVLRNRRRRLVLQAIEDRDGSTTLSELAEHIGGIENGKSPTALNAQERKRVYVGLYQCHLPKMHDAGAIEFDKDRGTVERGEIAEQYHEFLEREVDVASEWPKYYVAVAGGSVLVYLGALSLGLSTPVVPLASLVLIGALSTYHWIDRPD